MPIGSDAVASSGGGAHAISIPRLDLSLISGGSSTDVGNAPPQGPPSPDLKSRTIRQAIKPSQISSRLMTNTYFKSPVKPWVTPGSAKRNVDWAPSSHSTVFCPRSGSEHGIFSRYTRTHEVAALNLTGRVDRDIGYMASHTRAILRHDYAFAALSARPRTVLPKFDPNYQDPSPPKTPRALSPPRHPWQTSRTRNMQQTRRKGMMLRDPGMAGGEDPHAPSNEEDPNGVYTMQQRLEVFSACQLTPTAKELYLRALNIPSDIQVTACQSTPRATSTQQDVVPAPWNDCSGSSPQGSAGQNMAADAEPSLHNSEETSGNAPTHTQSDSGASKPVSSSLSNGASGPAEASETHEGFSITQAACLAARRRQSILDEWAQDRRQQRHARIPVPTPEELSDTEIQESVLDEHGVWHVVHHDEPPADQESAAIEDVHSKATKPTPEERLEKIKELNALEQLQVHEDYLYSGGLGRLSAQRDAQRNVYVAMAEANRTTFNPDLARQASRIFRDVAQDARRSCEQSVQQPGNTERRQRFARSLEELQSSRPHFHPPSPRDVRTRHKRMPWYRKPPPPPRKAPTPPPPQQTKWDIEESIFASRKRESDARDFYDTPTVLKKQLKLDWHRATAKKRFVKYIKAMDCRAVPEGFHPKAVLQAIESVLGKHFLHIRAAFYYYCARGTSIGEASFSMTSNSWGTFCRETGIEDPESKKCSSSALGSLFIAANFEETGALSAAQDKENDDNALMRLEWLEILVRAAAAKYIEDLKATGDVAEALDMLCTNHLEMLPPEISTDPNIFRQERMYNEDVDALLLSHRAFLEAVFNVYKCKAASKYLWMEHWMILLDNLRLVNDRTGIGITQAKILFMWSMMGSVDELTKRQKAVSWTFVDFIEGLARLADSLSLPTAAELDVAALQFAAQRPPGFAAKGLFRHWEYLTLVDDRYLEKHRRPSAGLISGVGPSGSGIRSNRPLCEKMDALLHLMVAGLCHVWALPEVNEGELCAKLRRAAATAGGGVELS